MHSFGLPANVRSIERFGRSYGTAKSGVGISAMSVLRPDLMMKCVVPVIMAGIIAVSILVFASSLLKFNARFERSTVSSSRS